MKDRSIWDRFLNDYYGTVAKTYTKLIVNSEKISDKQSIESCKKCNKYLSSLDWYELSPEEINKAIGDFIRKEYYKLISPK